jgi:predicted RNA binding protein YcfA (HicA-like mRNA interferase family)
MLSTRVQDDKTFMQNASNIERCNLTPKPYSYRQVIKALNKLGFRVVRQKGSHLVLKGVYNGINRTVVVPKHKEIAVGTLRGILIQTGIAVEEFIDLTEKA